MIMKQTARPISPVERPPLWTANFRAVTIGNFLLFFSFYLLLPILPMYVAEAFDADKSVTGMVLASYTVMALLVRPASGFLVDTFPRKRMLLICYTIFMLYFCGYLLAGILLLFALIRATHGLAFGLVTVSNSTMAIDIMPSVRRGEGIGYYGVSNNLAMAIGPSLSLYIYDTLHNFDYIFLLSILSSFLGLCSVATIKAPRRDVSAVPSKVSLDRFILLNALPETLPVILFSFSYGILSTYLAIYGREEIGAAANSALFFVIMAIGLISSRLAAGRMLDHGYIVKSIFWGMVCCLLGYAVFIELTLPVGYYTAAFILGIGYGTICSAFQAMFISMAPNSRRGTANSSYLTSWDLGVGLGVFIGGHIAEVSSYGTAYRWAWVVSLMGLFLFAFVVRKHYAQNKLE